MSFTDYLAEFKPRLRQQSVCSDFCSPRKLSRGPLWDPLHDHWQTCFDSLDKRSSESPNGEQFWTFSRKLFHLLCSALQTLLCTQRRVLLGPKHGIGLKYCLLIWKSLTESNFPEDFRNYARIVWPRTTPLGKWHVSSGEPQRRGTRPVRQRFLGILPAQTRYEKSSHILHGDQTTLKDNFHRVCQW